MSRTVLTGGILPERIGPAGELRRLEAARDAAERIFRRFHDDHFAEVDFFDAEDELEAFLVEHPELRIAPARDL